MVVGVAKEVFPGERRVAMVPAVIPSLTKAGIEVLVEPGAGYDAGYPDEAYVEKGAKLAADRDAVFAADVVFQVRAAGAAGSAGEADLPRVKKDGVVIAMADPLGCPEAVQKFAATGAALLALELVPRITRAQSMDVLSSMATIAGYRAVLLAATALPKMFPMMMTAAGTITPARVFVVGAGVAGLQAIASSKRLGAIVSAYDVRPVVKEQVESLGGKFLEIQLDTAGAEDKGGYAKQLDDEAIKKQQELMLHAVAESDVVITTAAVPGKKAPILLTAEMVRQMKPGSVVVDLAAERGGNCELTKPGETVVDGGVTILGPANLPAEIPYHASQMYAKNIATFLLNMVKNGQLNLNLEDEIVRDTLVTRDGKIANPRVAEILGIAIEAPATNG
ncbi:MAG: Re/Si-specific NAD(P)(+) transhydrogenase subunit alpha [Planctomycetaceae bacterium]|nr:Re/Si-specific NAD(P)(+) transhydrogenase subunit alpha [Planctomycetaceae bacterium]